MKPHISVIATVRERVSVLQTMLESLRRTAANPDGVEVVLRADHDDERMIQYLRSKGELFIVGPRRNGYATLAALVNEAARLSHADLVLVANDDLEFMTQGWDTKLVAAAARFDDGIFDLGVDTVMNNANFCFPCVSRHTMDVLGCFYDERLIYTDIWLRDVMMPFGRAVRVPEVTIAHQWRGMTADQAVALTATQTSEYRALYDRCVEEGRAKIRAALACPAIA